MDYAELKPLLARSSFRSRFRLTDRDRAYIAAKGWDAIAEQARKIVAARLAPAFPEHDGRQTPMRGHVVFVAQHATASCCRGCLAQWHRLPPGQTLTPDQTAAVVAVILGWLRDQAGDLSSYPRSHDLFD